MRAVSTYHFRHGAQTLAVTARRWHEARRLAARAFGCSEQDVVTTRGELQYAVAGSHGLERNL